MTGADLINLSRRALSMPAGCGDPFLEKISISELQSPYLRFMYLLAQTLKPQVIVECGVYMATCTGHMASASPESIVIGIDKDFHSDAWKVAYHYKNIVLITGDTVEQAEKVNMILNGSMNKIGILFLDSAHDGFTPMAEFDAYSPLFAEECIVCCDDIVGEQLSAFDQIMMRKFWDEMSGEQVNLHSLHPSYAGVPTPGFGASIIRTS